MNPYPIKVSTLALVLVINLMAVPAVHAVNSLSVKDQQFSDAAHAVEQMTSDGLYRVRIHSDENPIPLKKIHSWTIHIEDKNGKPVEDAKVFIFGGMPMHKHGFPTKPRVKEYLGNGNYKVEGIKFNMPGHWEMRFTIKQGREKDRIIYNLHLQ